MPRRVVGGPAVSGEIDQFLKCLEHAHGPFGTSRSMIDASREAIGVSRDRRVPTPRRSTDVAEGAVARHPFLPADDDTISQFVDVLAASYAAARDAGDEVGLEIYGKALATIGRHLALEIGPKVAGIKLS